MGFVSRGGEEVVRWGPGSESGSHKPARRLGLDEEGKQERGNGDGREEEEWKGGLAPGEEVLNHYCDIDLPVHARREWAVGALGGWCLCGRCVWESSENESDRRRGGHDLKKGLVVG